MGDVSDLVKLIKRASTDAVETTQPTAVLFGVVTATEPLEITVEQRFVLGMAQLILSRNVTEHTLKVSMAWEVERSGDAKHSHTATVAVESGGDPSHTHGATATVETSNLEHLHEVIGEKELVIHNALQLEEKVLLVRMQGGQKFLVVDRVVEE